MGARTTGPDHQPDSRLKGEGLHESQSRVLWHQQPYADVELLGRWLGHVVRAEAWFSRRGVMGSGRDMLGNYVCVGVVLCRRGIAEYLVL